MAKAMSVEAAKSSTRELANQYLERGISALEVDDVTKAQHFVGALRGLKEAFNTYYTDERTRLWVEEQMDQLADMIERHEG